MTSRCSPNGYTFKPVIPIRNHRGLELSELSEYRFRVYDTRTMKPLGVMKLKDLMRKFM